MKPRNTLTAIAVLMLLGLIATLITMPSETGQAWPWNRSTIIVEDDTPAPSARRDGIIGLTKRTIANAENITEAVKAAISAAGKVVDRTEARSEQPEVAKTAIDEAVKAAAMPLPIPPDVTVDVQQATGVWQAAADGSQYLWDQFGNWWAYSPETGVMPWKKPPPDLPAVPQAGDCSNCLNGSCPVRYGLFGRRGG